MGTLVGGFKQGLVEVADGVFAYLQPDGTWGWSNAGLIAGDSESVLIDTLFDLHLTRSMLETMEPMINNRPILSLVNTHANGDHCYGNQLVAEPGVEIIASAAAALEMDEVPPSLLAAMVNGATDGTLGEYIKHAFGAFDFDGIETAEPTMTFSNRHDIVVGGRIVELHEVGPAHTQGDVIAWLPEERVVFTGDILFNQGTPVMWAGPVAGWINALDTIIEMDPRIVVPGHGPLADTAAIVSQQGYFELLRDAVADHHSEGSTVDEAIRDIDRQVDRSPYKHWTDRERVVVNVLTIWKELEPTYVAPDVLSLFQMMADNFSNRRAGQ